MKHSPKLTYALGELAGLAISGKVSKPYTFIGLDTIEEVNALIAACKAKGLEAYYHYNAEVPSYKVVAMKKLKKARAISPKQQAVINYGKLIRAASNTYCLADELQRAGLERLAGQVRAAQRQLKDIALERYRAERLAIDPNWKPKPLELGAKKGWNCDEH